MSDANAGILGGGFSVEKKDLKKQNFACAVKLMTEPWPSQI